MELRTNITHEQAGIGDYVEVCSYDEEGQCREWRVYDLDTMIHLVVGMAMLAVSIYSASLTCLAKVEVSEGRVWGPQTGTPS